MRQSKHRNLCYKVISVSKVAPLNLYQTYCYRVITHNDIQNLESNPALLNVSLKANIRWFQAECHFSIVFCFVQEEEVSGFRGEDYKFLGKFAKNMEGEPILLTQQFPSAFLSFLQIKDSVSWRILDSTLTKNLTLTQNNCSIESALEVRRVQRWRLRVRGQYRGNIIFQQMLNQKSKFVMQIQSGSPIRLKPLATYRKLQSLKQKLMNQSLKISKFKSNQETQQNTTLHAIIKKKNKSNDSGQWPQIILDSLPQRSPRKISDARILLQQYFNNKQTTLNKNKSNLFPTNTLHPHPQRQAKTRQQWDRSSEQDSTETQPNLWKRETMYQQLKTSFSTDSSCPSTPSTAKIPQKAHSNPLRFAEPQHTKSQKQLKIQDFHIIKYLEEGQFGSVHLAIHLRTNFLCALKKIPKHLFGNDPNHINQLARQIKIQSYLQHPNIVHLYGFFHDQHHVYLMMEYIPGGSLYSSLKNQGCMPEVKVRKYLRQICQALKLMHQKDIIHRDIKPQNILLCNVIPPLFRMQSKICDFGWSVNSPLLRSTHCGTPLYNSPEIILRQQYDSKVDVWNVGVMAYELLCGQLPFEINSQQQLIKIVEQDVCFSRSHRISNAAKDFILRCLKKNPRERDSMNRLLDHQFFRF